MRNACLLGHRTFEKPRKTASPLAGQRLTGYALTVRCGIFTAKISGPNKALITFDYGISLSILRHGRLSTARIAGDVISVNGSGAPVIRS